MRHSLSRNRINWPRLRRKFAPPSDVPPEAWPPWARASPHGVSRSAYSMQCGRVTASSVRVMHPTMLLKLPPLGSGAPGSPRFHVERLPLRVAIPGPRRPDLPRLCGDWRRVGEPGARDSSEPDRLTVFHVEPAAGLWFGCGCPTARVAGHRQLTARGSKETIPGLRIFGQGKARRAGRVPVPTTEEIMAMPMRHLSGGFCLAVAAALFAATASAQSQPAAGAQASGQGAATADRSGASAQGGAAGAARADDTSANLASGSSVNAVLTKPVDSGRNKPGDPVSAHTTQPAKTEGGTSIPKGHTLIGHVSDARAAGDGQAGSSMGIVFDKAVTRDGHEIPLRNVGIQAVAAAETSAESTAGDTGAMPRAGGGAGSRGGGLLGRTTGAVGGTAGSSLGATRGVGSLAGGATGALQAGPGAMGGVDAAGMLSGTSSGVFGLRGLSLSGSAADAATGSVMTSTGKSVHLDQGTRFLLSSQGAASSQGGTAPRPSGTTSPDAKQPSGDRR